MFAPKKNSIIENGQILNSGGNGATWTELCGIAVTAKVATKIEEEMLLTVTSSGNRAVS